MLSLNRGASTACFCDFHWKAGLSGQFRPVTGKPRNRETGWSSQDCHFYSIVSSLTKQIQKRIHVYLWAFRKNIEIIVIQKLYSYIRLLQGKFKYLLFFFNMMKYVSIVPGALHRVQVVVFPSSPRPPSSHGWSAQTHHLDQSGSGQGAAKKKWKNLGKSWKKTAKTHENTYNKWKIVERNVCLYIYIYKLDEIGILSTYWASVVKIKY